MSIKRMSTQWIQMMKGEVCPGCANNRYNMGRGYQETPNDAPVHCDYCITMHTITYNRAEKRYECPFYY